MNDSGIDLLPEIDHELHYFSSFPHSLENNSLDKKVSELNAMVSRDKSFLL